MQKNGSITLKYKPDFDGAVRYWDAFWDGQMIDRPCTALWALKTPAPRLGKRLIKPTDDYELAFSAYEAQLEDIVALGEAIPGFRPGYGPDQMAAFLGADLEFHPDSPDTSWTKKIVDDWEKFLPIKFDLNNETFLSMKDYHLAAERRFKGKCLIYNIDTHSNIDTLEALRGSENLIYDMIDIPDFVEKAISDVKLVYKQLYDELMNFGDKKTIGTCTNLYMYSRGKTDMIQADFIALISPDMFRRFVLPAIEDEANFLDNSVFHLDGPDALKHLDDILSIKNIHAIQWQPGAGQKPAYEWTEVIDKIQKSGKAATILATVEQIKSFHGRYKPDLLFYEAWADSVEQGYEFLDWLGKNT